MMKYFCGEDRRRQAVARHGTLNGIDFLELSDDQGLTPEQRQRTLLVHFVKALSPSLVAGLTGETIIIEGGEKVRNVAITAVSHDAPNVLKVTVDKAGDFSTYRLRLLRDDDSNEPPEGIDPLLSAVDFSFKTSGPTELDCRAEPVCPAEPLKEPAIDYLAKDYASFRRLILDRLAVIMPGWRERNPADLGVALVELLAYVGDQLSYQQDAVATEAYLDTARRRISVRRHARLVDYYMHNGANARVWVQVQVNADSIRLPRGTTLFTRVMGNEVTGIPEKSSTHDEAVRRQPEIFETAHDIKLFQAHSRMAFYTWGARECCLPEGATRATLSGHFPNLKAGDVLVLMEVCGPLTGQQEDADPAHRHAVRLTHVTLSEDPLGGQFLDPPGDGAVPVTEIQWVDEDALPFPLCISSKTGQNGGGGYIEEVSAAFGNIVLADHGMTIRDEEIGEVPESKFGPARRQNGCGRDGSRDGQRETLPLRFRPTLKETPLTFAKLYDEDPLFGIDFDPAHRTDLDSRTIPQALRTQFANRGVFFQSNTLSIQGTASEWSISDDSRAYIVRVEERDERERLNVYKVTDSARAMISLSPEDALPAIVLKGRESPGSEESTWLPRRDLLGSSPNANEFVVEIESDGSARIRFGDDQFGKRPNSGTKFTATYRVGNGVRGNIGSKSLAHIVTSDPGIIGVWNPMPAQGGTEPETIDEVRQTAPYVFHKQARAVTPEDYAAIASRYPGVQKAAATLRWTGSWHTVFVTVDRFGGLEVDEDFEAGLRGYLERYRMAGHDIEVDGPRFIPLEIAMHVAVKPDYFRAHVQKALLQLFSSGRLPDGRRGIFHPDNFTFGQPVYLSRLYAAAEGVEGVASVQITTFQRQEVPGKAALDAGQLDMGRLEIARLDNDPDRPQRGVFHLTVEGGK